MKPGDDERFFLVEASQNIDVLDREEISEKLGLFIKFFPVMKLVWLHHDMWADDTEYEHLAWNLRTVSKVWGRQS